MNGTDIKPLIYIWFWSAKGIGYCYRWCCCHKKKRKKNIHAQHKHVCEYRTYVYKNTIMYVYVLRSPKIHHTLRILYRKLYIMLPLMCCLEYIFFPSSRHYWDYDYTIDDIASFYAIASRYVYVFSFPLC